MQSVLRGFDRPSHAFADRHLVRAQQLQHFGCVGPDRPRLAVLDEYRFLAEYLAGYLAVLVRRHGFRPTDVDDLGADLGDTRCSYGLFDVVILVQRSMDISHAGIDADGLIPDHLVDALRDSATPRAIEGEDAHQHDRKLVIHAEM